jgi:uncharacterized RDD family membrane protein YckC
MSDTSQGPGWWQASDGKWYPPESAPSSGASPSSPTMPIGAQYAGAAASGPLASWGQRVVGYLIDAAIVLVVAIVGFFIGIVLAVISDVLGAVYFFVFYVAITVAWFYFGFLVGANGRSPGMALTGLRCISAENGQLIGGGMGVVRTLCHIVDSLICYIGWLFPLWDPQRQTIADKIVKTVVVAEQPRESFGVSLFKP